MRRRIQWDESRIQPSYRGWTVIGPSVGVGNQRRVPCRCHCGNERLVLYQALSHDRTQQCRLCSQHSKSQPRSVKHGHTRNKKWTPEYQTWHSIKSRCSNKKRLDYELYGGRGISVSDRWLKSFANFLADVGTRPSPRHSLDRINNDGNYEPGNVRWATAVEQANNRRPKRPRSRTQPSQISGEIQL